MQIPLNQLVDQGPRSLLILMLVTSCAGQETDRYACGSTSGLTTPSQMGELTHLNLGMCKIIPKTWASCPDDIIMNHYRYIYLCMSCSAFWNHGWPSLPRSRWGQGHPNEHSILTEAGSTRSANIFRSTRLHQLHQEHPQGDPPKKRMAD